MTVLRKIIIFCLRCMGVAIIALTVLLLCLHFLGMRTYTVLSGSMEPVISTGSLIFVFPAKLENLKVGDMVTYGLGDNRTVTHRIVSVAYKDNERWFQTKGDANEAVDGGLVSGHRIVGKVVFTIPAGGYVVESFRSDRGLLFGFVIVVVGIFLMWPGNMSDKTKNRRNGKYLKIRYYQEK